VSLGYETCSIYESNPRASDKLFTAQFEEELKELLKMRAFLIIFPTVNAHDLFL
jgi:hypothetical protein